MTAQPIGFGPQRGGPGRRGRALRDVSAPRPQMTPEQFEDLAADAARRDVTLEFINGKVWVKPVGDGNHDEIAAWLTAQCMQYRPDLRVHGNRGLRVETYRQGMARPDITLAPPGAFSGTGEWGDPGPVLLVAEVTSFDYDTEARDRQEKPRAYAECGIPVFLLIDRDVDEITVYSDPVDGKYQSAPSYGYGDQVNIPVLGITLDTDELRNLTGRPDSSL
ncbi:Uma2 family endonuclease [Streptomyces coeruleoprunus]|uniref:Uma2 family endonuclease n=1 Tax=Streptomyces coeruleoprunus TaxID=285563 RepID=A0ABV9X7C1_9ACTN